MPKHIIACVLLVASFTFVPASAGEDASQRIKRGMHIKAVKLGLKAVATLLDKADNTGFNDYYWKKGNYRVALKDFYSVVKRDTVQTGVTKTGWRTKTGIVGDRRLKLSARYGIVELEISTVGKYKDYTIRYKP